MNPYVGWGVGGTVDVRITIQDHLHLSMVYGLWLMFMRCSGLWWRRRWRSDVGGVVMWVATVVAAMEIRWRR